MVDNADIVVGLCWGDEAKSKIVSHLTKITDYDLVARWGGGNNAGHTVYVNGKKYKTHIVPSGVFTGIKSLIGPGCVLHPDSFFKELDYFKENGFDISLVKVHPNCHIVTDAHIEYDKQNLAKKLGTTSKGIAPAYAAKAARSGIQAKDVLDKKYLWDEELSGNILCEGAQGVWLDINQGNYPYVTSSETLPYAACSIGFPPQKIRKIYGAAKIYDTKSGEDPLFPDSLSNDPELSKIAQLGQEFGVTTGRPRKVNWLRLDHLIKAINLTGATNIIFNKCDILEQLQVYKLIENEKTTEFQTLKDLLEYVLGKVESSCPLVTEVVFSYSPEEI